MYALMLAIIGLAWALVITGRSAHVLDQIERILGGNMATKPINYPWSGKWQQTSNFEKLLKFFLKEPSYVPPIEFSDDSEPDFQ
ncbi:hypothetical protein C0J52_17913 [Blattella germanica]|nr:hypothetical protein C0J52_17913 [Blattella germanica]